MAAAFRPAGDVFFTASHDGSLCLWRTADQAPLFSCKHADPILAGAFSHDGKRILIGCGKEGRLYDATRGTVLDPPLVHQDKVRAVAFSPDDRLVVTASDDGTAQLWETESRTRRGMPFSHRMRVQTAVFSPDGRLVLTGSADSTARLWDISTGRSVGPALLHRGLVTSAAFSPDGKRFVTGSSGHTAFLWKTPTPVEGEAHHLVLWTEVRTGMALDETERLTVLDAPTWEERRGRLQRLDAARLP